MHPEQDSDHVGNHRNKNVMWLTGSSSSSANSVSYANINLRR